jgi:hypothetical protein
MAKKKEHKQAVIPKTKQLTKEELIEMFPEKKRTINDDTVAIINMAVDDPEFNGWSFKSNLLEYRHIMKRRSGSIHEYVNAVKFVAYVESGCTFTEAYRRAFAYKDFVIKSTGKTSGSDYDVLVSSATRFARSPMVADIMTTADVAVSLLHRGNFNTAIGVLTDEMLNAKTAKDRIAAAATLVKELKPSEKIEMGIDIGFNEDAQKQIDQTNQQLAQVAKNQMALLKKGYSIDQIQQIHIRKTEEEAIDADVEE